MTYEEFYNLKPGDKVILDEDYREALIGGSNETVISKIFRVQEENGGYLTVKDATTLYNVVSVEEVEFPHRYYYVFFLLYCEPKPWSYERDY